MAWPIDPKQGFYRYPAKYVHDAFGHDGGVDGCKRVRPHSGGDSTPSVKSARALSVLGGKVVRTGWTIYAGNYVVVDAPDGWLWLDIHLASRLVATGADVGEGDAIGIVGNTGGGGSGPLAGKSGNLAIHLHTSRCKDMAAVDRIINGYVRARYKGETAAQWATAHGLSDPYPHIIKSVEDGKSSAPIEEDEMNDADRTWLQKALNDQEKRIRDDMRVNVAEQVALALTAANGAKGAAESARDALTKPVDGFAPIDVIRTHAVATLKAVREQASKQGVTLDETRLAEGVLDQLGKRIANG